MSLKKFKNKKIGFKNKQNKFLFLINKTINYQKKMLLNQFQPIKCHTVKMFPNKEGFKKLKQNNRNKI